MFSEITCRVSPVVEGTSLGPASSSHLLPTSTMGMSALLPLILCQGLRVIYYFVFFIFMYLINQLYDGF